MVEATHKERRADPHNECPAFNVLTPYPGTELFRTLESEGRLLYGGRWWLHPDYRVNATPFVPSRIDPDELTRALAEARHTWSRPLTILRRFLDFRTHLRSPYRAGVYLTAHRLRHSFANDLVSVDVPVTTIQKLLGHAWLESTQTYVAANDRKVQADYDAASQKLEGWQ